MRHEEHAHGWNARRFKHPCLAPTPCVRQLAQFRGPVRSGGALTERDHLARPPIREAMLDNEVEMRVLLAAGRLDWLRPSAFSELLGEFVNGRREPRCLRPSRKREQVRAVMLVAPEVALRRGMANILKVSLGTYTRTPASCNPEPAQEQQEDVRGIDAQRVSLELERLITYRERISIARRHGALFEFREGCIGQPFRYLASCIHLCVHRVVNSISRSATAKLRHKVLKAAISIVRSKRLEFEPISQRRGVARGRR